MPRTNGKITKDRILQVAENLFSEHGFDGTSIDMIARAAGVNRALIYYHFKNKDDIITELFRSILEETERATRETGDENIADAVRQEIQFMQSRKRVLTVMLMEALKDQRADNAFFRCAEMAIASESDQSIETMPRQDLLFEFFTGFIPMVSFIILRDKWCEYFQCDPDNAADYFTEAFKRTHWAAHFSKNIKPENSHSQ